MRAHIIMQLRELVKQDQIHIDRANEVLELYDDEVGDTSEATAYDKAQQDIQMYVVGDVD